MAKKSFNELTKQLTEAAKKSKVFSKDAFEDLVLAFANERDLEFGQAKVKNGELIVEKTQPGVFFEKLIYEVLVGNGHDKQEAEAVAKTFQFKKMDGAYAALSEIIFAWLETGKTFAFPTKEDFKGSIYLRDREEGVTEHKVSEKISGVPGGKVVKVKKKKHRTLERKSSAPDWLKANI